MPERLLNRKYATRRSAGNSLGGLNGITSTIAGNRIGGDP
jgi:hypothetical protein